MATWLQTYKHDLVKDYLWEIAYHKRCIKDVEDKLNELIKDYEVIMFI